MSDNKFRDLTADDFAEAAPTPAPAKAGTNPATGKPFTTSEVKREVLGPPSRAAEIEPNWLKRGLAGAGLGFVDKLRGLQGELAAEDYGLREDPVGALGALVPDMAGSMLAPARVIPQAAFGAATRAVEPAPNALERGVNALKGAAEFGGGQAVASGLVRGVNAATGNLSRPGQVASAAGMNNLDLTAGDLLDSKLMRLAEEKSFGSPSAKQVEQIATMMSDVNNNPLSNAVMNAYETAQRRVAAKSAELDNIITQNSLPRLRPTEVIKSLREIITHNPASLNAIDDVVLRETLKKLASKNPNRASLSFQEMDDLRKAVGPVMANIKRQAGSGSTNVTTDTANRWAGKEGLYSAFMKDLENWGGVKGLPEEALATHKDLRSTFKNEVLPLREHPVAGKIISGVYERPEDIVRDMALSQRNATINKQLYERLDQGGKNALDAFRLTGRGSKEFVRGESKAEWARPLALSAGLTAPAWAPYAGGVLPWAAGALAAEQGLVHGLNSRVGKAVISGAPEASRSPLLDAAIQAGLRTSAQGALTEMRR